APLPSPFSEPGPVPAPDPPPVPVPVPGPGPGPGPGLVGFIQSGHFDFSKHSTAAGVQSIISIASVNRMFTGVATFDFSISSPRLAISEIVHAPTHRQIRRDRSNSTSLPLRDFRYPKCTPADYVLTSTVFKS